MDSGIIIETERLILRAWNYSDISVLTEELNNLNVTKWLANIPYPYSEDDAKSFIKYSLDNHLYNFAIVLKAENKVIGGTQLSNIDKYNGTAGGGIWIAEPYWGNGYGKEAFNARIKYAFEELGLRRLENGYFKGNEKSHKMQLSLGYRDEGIRREKFICKSTGKVMDEYITGLLKDEWIK